MIRVALRVQPVQHERSLLMGRHMCPHLLCSSVPASPRQYNGDNDSTYLIALLCGSNDSMRVEPATQELPSYWTCGVSPASFNATLS